MNPDTPKFFNDPVSLRELAISFQQSRILLSAFELELFTAMDGHLSTHAQLAEKLNVNADGLSRLLDALTAMGIIKKTHGKFFNSEEASCYLVKGKPEYMAGLMHINSLWNNWSTLTDAVKKGSSVIDRDKNAPSRLNSFISAMHYRAVPQSKIISLLIDFDNVNKMLDLGGGSGAYAMTFLKNHSNLKAVLFDVPGVIELAKNYVEQENLQNRFEYIMGNYLTDSYGEGYDLIFASAIIHINSFEENKNLVKKCFDALNPGGQLVISDFVMNDDRTEPKIGAVFAINMLVSTSSGNTYTEKEMTSWLKDAGFAGSEKKNTSFGSSLLIGKKL